MKIIVRDYLALDNKECTEDEIDDLFVIISSFHKRFLTWLKNNNQDLDSNPEWQITDSIYKDILEIKSAFEKEQEEVLIIHLENDIVTMLKKWVMIHTVSRRRHEIKTFKGRIK